MDENKIVQLLSHTWEILVSIVSATIAYIFYKKRKHDDQLDRLVEDNIVFKVEIREIKEDLRDIKDYLFSKRKINK